MIQKNLVQIKLGEYGTAAATALSDPSILPEVQQYKRQVASRLYPLAKSDIDKRVPESEYFVSRKIDGEFCCLVYRDGELFTVNPGGTVRVGLPWAKEALTLFEKADVQEAFIPGELYVNVTERRSRVHDVVSVARQPDSAESLAMLRFAVFDILTINGKEFGETGYDERWREIQRVFEAGEQIHPVETQQVKGTKKVEKLFDQWVEGEGAEGIVIRSDSAGNFKAKPRHTIDAVVIGFTESTDDRQGMMHDLLLAVSRSDGALQVLCRVGGGFSEDERREMLSDLKDRVVDSEYAEVNGDHVAYQMVKPEWVVEINCLDMISQNTRGSSVNRMVLRYNDSDSQYEVVRRMPLVSVISPQFVRRREDKSVNINDIRIDQVTDIVPVDKAKVDASELTLPKSEVMQRAVYTKELKGATMVRKFLMWKTNKENVSDEFPAFVLHYTDFSPNRKVPLAREVRVSSSEEQIRKFWNEFVAENIKKGWAEVE
jgi:hypothetical protein